MGTGASLEEIETAYRKRLPEFRRVAAAITADRELARDAVQEAFARAVRERGSFRADGSLHAWLWRIVVNAARDEAKLFRVDHATAEPSALAQNGRAEGEAERVREAVALLPERQRLVLFLRYYADLDYGMIADALDISVGTVGATLNAAHQAMRRLLAEVKA